MKTMIWTLFMCLLLNPLFKVNAQYQFFHEGLPGNDFGGILTAGSPDFLDFDEAYLDHSKINFRGGLSPTDLDYNDLFYFEVPAGYQITEIRYTWVYVSFSGLDFHLWEGPNCSPLNSPDISTYNVGQIDIGEPAGPNMIAGFGSLTPGFYAARVTHNGWPSATHYRVEFTFECTDNTPPVFTSIPGSLDATLSCTNAIALAAALAAEPVGTDNLGSVTLSLTGDDTEPLTGCPNAYTRTRTWNLQDECGNFSLNDFVQTITVIDDDPPVFTTPAGALDVTLDCENKAGEVAAIINLPLGTDGCGSAHAILINDTVIPDPGCPNAYVRIRQYRMLDECGNMSVSLYQQTITVQDFTPPQWTTPAGSLDVVGLECSDLAGIAAANAMAPIGTDACGTATAVLISDQTFPDPQCPNAYERFKVWALVDECGNAAAGIRSQSITVVDNNGPVVVPSNGTVAIYEKDGYELLLEDLLDMGSSFDACGGDLTLVSADPMMVTCEDLGQVIPVEFVVSDVCGNTTVAVSNIEVTQDLSIKPPWNHQDIGASADGDALHYVCEEEYHIWSDGQASPYLDVAHFVYVELCGDGELIARVQNVDVAGGFAGVMIRENLAQGSMKMALRKSSTNSLRRDIRMNTNMMQNTMNSIVPPASIWMRITRSGKVITLFSSMDGLNWTFRGTAQPNMGDCVLWGLYTESAMHNHVVTGIFDHVEVTGDVQPVVAAKSIFTDHIEHQTESTKEQLNVYPNPGNGLFNLDISEYTGQTIQTEVYTADGRLISRNSFTADRQTHEINIRNHPPGMYLLKVIPNAGIPMITKLISN